MRRWRQTAIRKTPSLPKLKVSYCACCQDNSLNGKQNAKQYRQNGLFQRISKNSVAPMIRGLTKEVSAWRHSVLAAQITLSSHAIIHNPLIRRSHAMPDQSDLSMLRD